jgi:hypothetical protein
MKNIETFYGLAFKYGFIDESTYVRIILKFSIDALSSPIFSESSVIEKNEYNSELLYR